MQPWIQKPMKTWFSQKPEIRFAENSKNQKTQAVNRKNRQAN
jgi:hypothetical protein